MHVNGMQASRRDLYRARRVPQRPSWPALKLGALTGPGRAGLAHRDAGHGAPSRIERSDSAAAVTPVGRRATELGVLPRSLPRSEGMRRLLSCAPPVCRMQVARGLVADGELTGEGVAGQWPVPADVEAEHRYDTPVIPIRPVLQGCAAAHSTRSCPSRLSCSENSSPHHPSDPTRAGRR